MDEGVTESLAIKTHKKAKKTNWPRTAALSHSKWRPAEKRLAYLGSKFEGAQHSSLVSQAPPFDGAEISMLVLLLHCWVEGEVHVP